jgi:hypothetical protein
MRRRLQRRDQYAVIYAQCRIITNPSPAKRLPSLPRDFNSQDLSFYLKQLRVLGAVAGWGASGAAGPDYIGRW